MKRLQFPAFSPRRWARATAVERLRRASRRRFSPAADRLEDRRLLTSTLFTDAFGAGGSNTVSVEAQAIDSSGNTYIAGGFTGTVSFGGITLSSPGSENIFVAKLAPSGGVFWADKMGSVAASSGDFGRGLALDSNGNVYVTGWYSGNAQFGGVSLTNAGGNDVFVTKINNSGTVLWADGFGGAGSDDGQSIALDGSGNVLITGSYTQSAKFGSTTLTANAGSSDVFVTKLNNAGAVQWAESMGGTAGNSGFGIAADSSNNIYVIGNFSGTGNFGAFNLTSAGMTDIFVTKIAAGGLVTFALREGGTGNDDGVAITVDSGGNIDATGDFIGSATFGNSITLNSKGADDAFVEQINGSGGVKWADDMGGTGQDSGFGITANGQGTIYTTGIFNGTANFGGVNLTSNGGSNVYVAKLTLTGTVILAFNFGSTASDQAYSIAIGATNNAISIVGSYGTGFNVNNDGLPASSSGMVIQLSETPSKGGSEALSNFANVGHSQLAVFRPATQQWFSLNTPASNLLGTFGASTDIPVAGDYDHLGHSELAVFRPSTQQWFVLGPTGGKLLATFGASTDVPVPGNYDSVGHTEPAVFRPSTCSSGSCLAPTAATCSAPSAHPPTSPCPVTTTTPATPKRPCIVPRRANGSC